MDTDSEEEETQKVPKLNKNAIGGFFVGHSFQARLQQRMLNELF